MGLKIKGAYSAILSKKSLKDKKNPRNGKKIYEWKKSFTTYQDLFELIHILSILIQAKKGSSDQDG